jgi:RNA polymerase sigma-70 factor (ECF subfamily)
MNSNPERNAQPAEAKGLFTATSWTVIRDAEGGSMTALNSLCTVYRKALFEWLRIRGTEPEEIEDILQGFFLHLLEVDFLATVKRERGRFRSFLLTAIQNYMADQWRRSSAEIRGGGRSPDSLDEVDEDGRPVREAPSREVAPDRAFDRAWAHALLDKSVQLLREKYKQKGQEALYAELERVLYADPEASAYADIAEKMGKTGSVVKMDALRMRQRLAAIISDEVRQTLTDERDLRDEIQYLRGLFRKPEALG